MENTKIGNKEAIALLVTVTFNQIILNVTKTILDTTGSASLLNILLVGIITIIFTCVICYFLNKFPAFDLIDISDYLGGKVLKWIIGLLYICYFIFFAGNLLHIFSSCLQIVYFPLTALVFIRLFFVIATVVTCLFKNNAIFKSTLIIFPLLIISTLFLFFSDMMFFDVDKIYPIFGNGVFTTFVIGLSNIFIFQSLAYIYFMPPLLKNPKDVKKISVNAIVTSCILVLLSLATVLLLFNQFPETNELMPLYSAVRYIEYGSFFQKMDSIFLLIWIISFLSYLGISLKFASGILKKLTYTKKDSIFIFVLGILLFLASGWQKNYTVSTFVVNNVYKYAFLILVIGISFLVLAFACIKKQKIKKR